MKTRFCPSPTGFMHVGNLRTALFNFLYAKANGGTTLLRIEDTDMDRSHDDYTQSIFKDLNWLGIQYDEGYGYGGSHGPYKQSERHDVYRHYYEMLINNGHAYPCFCTEEQLQLQRKVQLASGKPPRYNGVCRNLTNQEIKAKLNEGLKPALRYHVPQGKVIRFKDMVRGEQTYLSDDIGDFIIRRQTESASFMFSNAVDDALMGVTHAIRGEDHLTNTPRQILLLEVLKLPPPQYGHISMIIGLDRLKLSKRNGSVSVQQLREQGYLPEAIMNYLARLGHHYHEEGYLEVAELIHHFKAEQLVKSPAMFDLKQLDVWQKQSIHRCDSKHLESMIEPTVKSKIPSFSLQAFIDVIKHNICFGHEFSIWATIFYDKDINYESSHLNFFKEVGYEYFHQLLHAIQVHYPSFVAVKEKLSQSLGLKGIKLFKPLRIALTAREDGPEMHDIFRLLDKNTAIYRVQFILNQLQKVA